MPVLKGLIFDLDGTLMNSAPDLRQAVNKTLKAHARRPLTLAEVESFIGEGMLTLLSKAFAATGAPLADSDSYQRFQEFVVHYRNQDPDPDQIYPGVVDTLAHYKKIGLRLGLCTNKQEAATLQLLHQLNLFDFFDAIAGGDTFEVHKPHPGHVTGVLTKLGIPPENAVMIGDGPHDVTAARAAGVATIVVTHGYGGDFHLLKASALIANFGELSSALSAIGFTHSG